MNDFDIIGYTYRVETLCPECLHGVLMHHVLTQRTDVQPAIVRSMPGWSTEHMLDYLAEREGVDRDDEYTFDSDHFPKVILRYQAEAEPDLTCDSCAEAVDSSLVGRI